MRAVFRFDASPMIGAGHAYRCLTLAEALSQRGWVCQAAVNPEAVTTVPALKKDSVFTMSESTDIEREVDWLIVDHFGLDADWEAHCRDRVKGIFVIDDLANRKHDCDLLLDQTLGRAETEYRDLIPTHARILLGLRYALLRSQFAEARQKAQARRNATKHVGRILVNFGGGNQLDVTALTLQAIGNSRLEVEVDVVIGGESAQLSRIREIASALPQKANVLTNVSDMAGLMVAADVAIGAAGSSMWERMCLGLPSISIVLAPNQAFAARMVSHWQAAIVLDGPFGPAMTEELSSALSYLKEAASRRLEMSNVGFSLVDGLGAQRIAAILSDEMLSSDEGTVS